MKTETMYRIVDQGGQWVTLPMKFKDLAWRLLTRLTERREEFERIGYRCVEVLVTPKERE